MFRKKVQKENGDFSDRLVLIKESQSFHCTRKNRAIFILNPYEIMLKHVRKGTEKTAQLLTNNSATAWFWFIFKSLGKFLFDCGKQEANMEI